MEGEGNGGLGGGGHVQDPYLVCPPVLESEGERRKVRKGGRGEEEEVEKKSCRTLHKF